jgi:hypothetical protein
MEANVKLWHLKWIEEPEVPWGKAMAFAVVAESEQQSRELAVTQRRGQWADIPYYGDEGPEPWLNPELTECIEVDMSKSGVIVRDIREG